LNKILIIEKSILILLENLLLRETLLYLTFIINTHKVNVDITWTRAVKCNYKVRATKRFS